MTYSIRFRPIIEVEVEEAFDWYENQLDHLGDQFLAAIDDVFGEILANPYKFQIRYNKTRIAVINRFPYLVLFTVDESSKDIVVLGVLHQRRNPLHYKLRK